MSSTGGGIIIPHNSQQNVLRNGKHLTIVNNKDIDFELAEEHLCLTVDLFGSENEGNSLTIA